MRKSLITCLGIATMLTAAAATLVLAADPPQANAPSGTEVRPPREGTRRGSPPGTTTAPAMPLREGREDGDRMRGRRPFSPEQTAEFTEFAKKHFPELYEKYEQMRKDEPARAGMLMRHVYRLWGEVRFYPDDVRAAAIERHKLNMAIFRARREYLDAKTDAERETLKTRLRELLVKQFDQDMIVKQYEVKRLEKQLADLKARIAQYEKEKDKIIDERVDLLTAPPPPPGPPPKGKPPEGPPPEGLTHPPDDQDD